jgi:hypothetical protein
LFFLSLFSKVSELGISINRSYLAVAIVVVILAAALVYYASFVKAQSAELIPAGLNMWSYRRLVYVNVFADWRNASLLLGTKPWVSVTLSEDYIRCSYLECSDLRIVHGSTLLMQSVGGYNNVCDSSACHAYITVSFEALNDSRGLHSFYVWMYYGNPSAKMFSVGTLPEIGWAWRTQPTSSLAYDTWSFDGVRAPFASGPAVVAIWVRTSVPNDRFYINFSGKTAEPLKIALYKGKWDWDWLNSVTLEFYPQVESYRVSWVNLTYVTNGTKTDFKGFAVLNATDVGWYTIVYWFDGFSMGITRICNSVGWCFGNAIELVKVDDYRFRLVPLLWDQYYVSVDYGPEEAVAAVVPASPTVVWNTTIGNAFFAYYVEPRTVTVYVPTTVTVATPVYITLPPSTTVTTTIYVPAGTITTWIALPPATVTIPVTVTVPEFTSRVYTTTVYVPTTITLSSVAPVTTTVPVTSTTTVGGSTTVTTVWVTTTTTTTYYYYTTTTITSPWEATIITPYTTITRTVTTAIPVTTTIYAPITVPVYYTTTVTLVNTNTSTVTTSIKVNGTVTGASGAYVMQQPVVVGPYGEVTTSTVYWVVKSPYTVTTTVYGGGSLPVAPSYGWLVLLAMIAIIGVAIVYLVRKR